MTVASGVRFPAWTFLPEIPEDSWYGHRQQLSSGSTTCHSNYGGVHV